MNEQINQELQQLDANPADKELRSQLAIHLCAHLGISWQHALKIIRPSSRKKWHEQQREEKARARELGQLADEPTRDLDL